MKILSTAQIREADAYTIANEPVTSIDLMERAAKTCSVWLLKKFGREPGFFIFCGNGNNGGDGLAIARQLAEQGASAEVFIARVSANDSADFTANLARLQKQGRVPVVVYNPEEEPFFPVTDGAILIDAVFGSGLSREPEGLAASVIDYINSSAKLAVVAIDIPSGLYGEDNRKQKYTHVVKADFTLSFQQPKLAFLFAENAAYTGEFHLADIGLHPAYIASAVTPYHYVTHPFARVFYRPRGKFGHKGTYGHALLVAGAKGKTGAAVLAAEACLRSGAGLVSVCAPQCSETILQTALPEAMLDMNEGMDYIRGRIQPRQYSAIGFGPGIGTEKETAQSLKLLLNEYAGPLVLDADALNILSENKTWMAFLPKGTILTPHPGEFDRLSGKHTSGYERMLSQKEMAVRFGLYIVLKGAHTSIACPDGQVYFNSSGNPGMATGGSGDVLTGILTGLRAQGYDPLSASVLGVYLHGLAGDIAASVQAKEGLIAGDIVRNTGAAWRMLQEA